MWQRAGRVSLFFVPFLGVAIAQGCSSNGTSPADPDAAVEATVDGNIPSSGDSGLVIGAPCTLGARVCVGTVPRTCEACGPTASSPAGPCTNGGTGTAWVNGEACNVKIQGGICVETATSLVCECESGDVLVDGGCVADAGAPFDAGGPRDGGDAGKSADGGIASDAGDAGSAFDAADATDSTDSATDASGD